MLIIEQLGTKKRRDGGTFVNALGPLFILLQTRPPNQAHLSLYALHHPHLLLHTRGLTNEIQPSFASPSTEFHLNNIKQALCYEIWAEI